MNTSEDRETLSDDALNAGRYGRRERWLVRLVLAVLIGTLVLVYQNRESMPWTHAGPQEKATYINGDPRNAGEPRVNASASTKDRS